MNFETAFGPTILTKSGEQPTADVLANKRFVGLYFSAHWCPPCRQFTPVLSETYTTIQDEDENALEVIFVSSDRDEGSFQQYHNTMSFCALPFSARAEKDALAQKFGISGIPSLIILDSNGNVVDTDGRSTVGSAGGNVSKILRKWTK